MAGGPARSVALCPGCFLVLTLTACLGARSDPPAPQPRSGGTLITRDEIRAMNAHTAMEALEKANTPLVIQHTRAGSPARIYWRGVGSILLNGEVQVAVDGALVQDGIRALQTIPAESVQYIQLLTGREAAVQWGSAAGNGVILVRTTASAGG